MLDYLHADSRLNGYPTTARRHVLTAEEHRVVADTFASLPEEIRSLAERYVAAISFVTELGSSAWSEFMDPPDRRSFLVFDTLVLHETPNAWATRRERSGFEEQVDLRLEIADPAGDVPGGGFRFIFLHELGHAVAHGRRLLPSWVDPDNGPFPYMTLVANTPPFAPRVRFYAAHSQRLAAAFAPEIYARWNTTAAPTLYATTDYAEDFAESFASYAHVQLLGQPYRLFVGGQRYENGIRQPRCAEKRAFIAALLKR